MVKTIQIKNDTWAELYKRKSEIVAASNKSPSYSDIIMEALKK